MKFKSLVFCLAVGLLIVSYKYAVSQSKWQSQLVQYDEQSGDLSYNADPNSGIRIADFSVAGYQGGGVPIPNIDVKITLNPVNGDNTQHIQNAINTVSAMALDQNGFRGTVLLNPGIYEIYGIININKSGVVLRGSGMGENSQTNTVLKGMGNNPQKRPIIKMGGGINSQFKDKVPNTQTNITSALVKVGDKKFVVENVAPYSVGDNIIIYHPCTQAWVDAVDGGGTGSDASWTEGEQPIIFNTRITKIACDTIYTNSPVFNTLDRSISQCYIYKYSRNGLVENIGVEDLRIDIEFDANNLDSQNHAKNGIEIIQAENAWVRSCTILHFYFAGVDMRTVNYVSIIDCNALEPKGPTDGGFKYNFCASAASQNVLMSNCTATEGRHNFVSNGTSSVAGLVFHKCTSIDPHTASEGHRRWTTGILFDQFRDYGNINTPTRVLGLYNRGRYGTGHGWSSANSVVWNGDFTRFNGEPDGRVSIQRPPTAQNFAIGCKGNISGSGPFSHPTGYIEGTNVSAELIPNSLYDAQLNYRLNNAISNTNDPCNSVVYSLKITNGTANGQSGDLFFEAGTPINIVADPAPVGFEFKQWEGTWGALSPDRFSPEGTYTMPANDGRLLTATYEEITTNIGHMLNGLIQVYPNPTNGVLNINLDQPYDKIRVEITNLYGHLIQSYDFQNEESLNLLLNEQNGVYLLKLMIPEREAYSSMIVIR